MAQATMTNSASRTNATASTQARNQSADTDQTKKKKPFTVAGSGDRKVLIPKAPNGKTLYFFFGYTGSAKDVKMRDSEVADLSDDVVSAAARGFKVVYDKAGTKADFLTAVYDSTCYGIYWSGHGYMDGNIQSSDGKVISPSIIDKTRVSSKIQYLILAACGSGVGQAKWKAVMGSQCQFQGWVKTTTTSETRDFTSGGVFDSWASHNGTDPSKELDDYINRAASAK